MITFSINFHTLVGENSVLYTHVQTAQMCVQIEIHSYSFLLVPISQKACTAL